MLEKELIIIDKKLSESIENLLPNCELEKFLNSGSKRIRSKVALLYAKAYEKDIDDNIYRLLVAVELIHNASLLHDDVIDDSDLRRGESTIGKKFTSKISILSGDYLVSQAVKLLLKMDNSNIMNIFNQTIQNMAKAEIKQYFFRGKSPDKDNYIDICKNKTASLFVAILKSMSILLNLDVVNAEKFGELFGLCYQIKNDFEEFSSENDKKNRICTAKDIFGIEKSKILSDNYKEELRELINLMPKNIYKFELEDLINKL